MKGKLVVIEGVDGSGKSTQFNRLVRRLEQEKTDFRTFKLPRYSEPSSAPLRMYLNGDFGDDPDCVNAYAASVLFAVDRYASYKLDWGAYYDKGGLVLADRYTTSNAVHQGAKLGRADRGAFFDWLFDLEYGRMELPKPDLVLLLDMPTELSLKLIGGRDGAADIHERDVRYLRDCRVCALDAAQRFSWRVVPCAQDGKIRGVEDIHAQIYGEIKRVIG